MSDLDWFELEFQGWMLCFYYGGSFFTVLGHGKWWGLHGSGAHWEGVEYHANYTPRVEQEVLYKVWFEMIQEWDNMME